MSSDGSLLSSPILGLHEALPEPVRLVGGTGQTGLPRVLLVLIILTIVTRSSAF